MAQYAGRGGGDERVGADSKLVMMPALKLALNSRGGFGNSPGVRTPSREMGNSRLRGGRAQRGSSSLGMASTRLAQSSVTRAELLTAASRAKSDLPDLDYKTRGGGGGGGGDEVKSMKQIDSTSTISDAASPSRTAGSLSCGTLQLSSDDGPIIAKSAVDYCEEFPVGGEYLHPSRFAKVKLLGRGAVGQVYLVRLLPSEVDAAENAKIENKPHLYAMKVVSKDEMISKNKVGRVLTEREVLASCAHPYIVPMYASFQTSSKLYYCMEYMAGGEFFRMLQRQKDRRLNEDAARLYAAEVVLALEYLHRMGFVYRDLKPENVLMRGDGHIALADFDLSKQAVTVQPKLVDRKLSLAERLKGSLALKKSNSKLDMLELVAPEPVLAGDSKSFVGTAEYIAPEVISGVSQTPAVDWWTLGIFIYEMIFGVVPFQGATQKDTFENVMKQELKFPSVVPVSRDCKDLIRRLLNRDPSKRLGAEFGAAEIKSHKWFSGINFALIRNVEAPIRPVVRSMSAAAMNEALSTLADLDVSSSAISRTSDSQTPESEADSMFAAFSSQRYGSPSRQ
eukprot:CAMPEP_0185833704 /NCGR_PEP_ID=MMETSP1353-20130828/3328_1 /TAXON_ID=1077150 /ORGANISM="Erythrolobus australicus, Strain CCMP3124" /LENGTH=564 /DNA_ID=CAMNT_0028532027 /DNA_START=88 /DNA_END=1782 /DNA_ORIENTATION=+